MSSSLTQQQQQPTPSLLQNDDTPATTTTTNTTTTTISTETKEAQALAEATTTEMIERDTETSNSTSYETNTTSNTITTNNNNNEAVAVAADGDNSLSTESTKVQDVVVTVETISINSSSSSNSSTMNHPTGQQQQQQQQQSNGRNNVSNINTDTDTNDDDDDITSKAAVALAAVAAAANAKHHKSPAEAAREARDLAHTFIAQATSSSSSSSSSSSLLVSDSGTSSSATSLTNTTNSIERNSGTTTTTTTVTTTSTTPISTNSPGNNHAITTSTTMTPGSRSTQQQQQALITVPIHAVKSHLRKRAMAATAASNSNNNNSSTTTTTTTASKLLHNENDPFLQHLLLLEHYRCISTPNTTTNATDHANTNVATTTPFISATTVDFDPNSNPTTTATDNSTATATNDGSTATTPSNSSNNNNHDDESILMISQQACERLEAVYRRVENAYDSLVDRLPPPVNKNSSGVVVGVVQPKQQLVPKTDDTNIDDTTRNDIDNKNNNNNNNISSDAEDDEDDDVEDEDGFDAAIVVPDLLPSCISEKGDLTISFFRACMGESTTTTSNHSSTNVQQHQQPSSAGINSSGGGGITKSQESVSNTTTTTATTSYATSEPPLSPSKTSSVFSSLFKRPTTSTTSTAATTTITAKTAFNVFRKSKQGTNDGKSDTISFESSSSSASTTASDTAASRGHSRLRPGEYVVKIEREMLGLTVENVLERTVVRTVVPNGPAKKAGARVGSLIVKVGNVETKNLTHFETIDELRQSNRPLQLVMRQISDTALQSAREEMGRLIKGYGFGTIFDNGNRPGADSSQSGEDGDGQNQPQHASRPLIEADLRTYSYTNLIRRRCAEVTPIFRSKKDEALAKASEKLIWILTLLIVGLEREAKMLFSLYDENTQPSNDGGNNNTTESPPSLRRTRSTSHHHKAKDYIDAAKSISKVLHDFTMKKMDTETFGTPVSGQVDSKGVAIQLHPPIGRNNRVPPRRHLVPGGKFASGNSNSRHETPLLQIGDVLQRTRTFLADPTSPPAALLRGEVISLLCDILDLDTEMELSEEEAVSSTAGPGAGAGAGVMNDLGSAGSLLKLIVLNCPIMRSPCCDEVSRRNDSVGTFDDKDSKKRLEPKRRFSSSDLHRHHAGNRFLAVVHRLAASRSTSSRIAACSLAPVLWGHLDFPYQLQLRGVITRALHDVEVIVRKSTATVLHEIAELVFDVRSVPWLVLMCERAMTDPEPQLRSAAMTLTWHLAEHLPNAFLGDARQGSRYLRRLPKREDPLFADVYLLQCKLLPVATRLAEDRSPSVRLAVAAQCDRLCDALGYHWSSVIIDVLLGLLSDSDERVRCEAVSCVPRLSEIVLQSSSSNASASSEVSILEALLPASTKLQKDVCVSVRVALATAAGELLTLLVSMSRHNSETSVQPGSEEQQEYDRKTDQDVSKKYKIQVDDRLIPMVQTLLNDVDPEVTSAALRAVSNATRSSVLHSRPRHMSVASFDDDASFASSHSHGRRVEEPVFHPVLSENQVLRLLPILTDLADSRQWRVRQSAVEIVPALLGCTSSLTTRSAISKLCIRLMADQVDAVRKTAAECLCMGGSSLGSHGENAAGEWISEVVFPTLHRCAIDPQSKQRLLCLKMVEVILLNGVCPTKWYGSSNANRTGSPIRELITITLSLTSDRIANVRLNVGRTLELVMHLFDEQETSLVINGLKSQIELEKERDGGGDIDVLFFANRCLRQAESIVYPHSQEHDS